jgi:hypothetical protein
VKTKKRTVRVYLIVVRRIVGLKKNKATKTGQKKFSIDCIGKNCTVYHICQSGGRIVDSMKKDPCAETIKRFRTMIATNLPKKEKTVKTPAFVEKLIKETETKIIK